MRCHMPSNDGGGGVNEVVEQQHATDWQRQQC